MRASAQIRKRDSGQRKRVNCEIDGLFGLGTSAIESLTSFTRRPNTLRQCNGLPISTPRYRERQRAANVDEISIASSHLQATLSHEFWYVERMFGAVRD